MFDSRWYGRKVQEIEYNSSAWNNLDEDVYNPSVHISYDLGFFHSETYELILPPELLWGGDGFRFVICFVMRDVIWAYI